MRLGCFEDRRSVREKRAPGESEPLLGPESLPSPEIPKLITRAKSLVGPLGWRVRQELNLLLRQLKVIALCWAWWYVVCPLAMNVAHYRYRAGPRLLDMGFEVIPELPEYQNMAELLPKMFIGWVLTMAVFAQRPVADGEASRPYGVNAVRRWCVVFSAAHTLRAATFLPTTLPGTAVHCLPEYDWRANQPDSPFSLLPSPGWPTKSCGDLVFSGHMTVVVLCSCVCYKYTQQMLGCSLLVFRIVMSAVLLMAAIQAVLIISSRNHYTMDVVIAIYLIPLLWHAHESYFPDDMEPDDVGIARQVLFMIPGALSEGDAQRKATGRMRECIRNPRDCAYLSMGCACGEHQPSEPVAAAAPNTLLGGSGQAAVKPAHSASQATPASPPTTQSGVPPEGEAPTEQAKSVSAEIAEGGQGAMGNLACAEPDDAAASARQTAGDATMATSAALVVDESEVKKNETTDTPRNESEEQSGMLTATEAPIEQVAPFTTQGGEERRGAKTSEESMGPTGMSGGAEHAKADAAKANDAALALMETEGAEVGLSDDSVVSLQPLETSSTEGKASQEVLSATPVHEVAPADQVEEQAAKCPDPEADVEHVPVADLDDWAIDGPLGRLLQWP